MTNEFSDDTFVELYNCNDPENEERPDSVVYHPIFEELKNYISEAASLLRDPLQESSYQNVIIRGLLNEVQTRTKDTTTEEVMFAVAGDMNSGKSSVINSILSIGVIARKGDGGGSCTWVVQRFKKTFADQKAPFAAKVTFFNTEEIRDIITSLLAKWWRASGKDTDPAEGPDGEDTKVENFSDIRTVLDAFCALFCSQAEFESEEAATQYLNRASSERDSDIIEELCIWAQDVVLASLDGDSTVNVEAPTPEELLFLLQPYTYTLGGEDGQGFVAPWPLVSCIDFGLSHPILDQGIIFVDAAGLSDSNTTRASNAVSHHRKCTHKITVADIARAKDDKSLRENLALGFRTRGSGNTVLVITKGDTIDGDTEVNGSKLGKANEQKLRDEVKVLRTEKSTLNQKRQRVSREERLDVEEDIRAIATKLQAKMNKYEGLRMEMRNRNVLKTICGHYRQLTGDAKPLPAFVVGNEMYKRYQAGFPAEERPTMTVQQTGIPELRKCIYLIPAEGKLNEVLDLALIQLPSLINSFELYCAKTHMARKSEIEAIILQPKQDLLKVLRIATEKLKSELAMKVLNPMKADEARWVQAARKLCRTWAVTYKRSHLALLKKEGYRKGNKKSGPDINWNAQLIEIARDGMEDCHKNFMDVLLPILGEIAKEVSSMMDKIRTKIRGDRQFNLMALDPFLQCFTIERPKIARAVQVVFKTLKTQSGAIGKCVSRQGYDPIYAEIHPIRGRDAVARRIELFSKSVTKMSGVWTTVHDDVETAFHKVIADHLGSVEFELIKIFDGIHAKFNLICEDTVVKDETEKRLEEKLRAKLGKNLEDVKALMDGPIRQAAETCKNYSKQKAENSLFVNESRF